MVAKRSTTTPVILAGPAGETLAKRVCRELGAPLGRANMQRFNDGEIFVDIAEPLSGKDVYIIGATHPPADRFFELALLARAARGLAPRRLTLVVSYLGYNRHDKTATGATPNAALPIELLVHAQADRVMTIDLHAPHTTRWFASLTVEQLSALPAAAALLAQRLKEPFHVVSPDAGGRARAHAGAQLLGKDTCVVGEKRRTGDGKVAKDGITFGDDCRGHDVLMVDDMIDTGGTLIAAAQALKAAGARRIVAFATHALLSNNALARLDQSAIDELIIADTIPRTKKELRATRLKVTVVSAAPLIAAAIKRSSPAPAPSPRGSTRSQRFARKKPARLKTKAHSR